jgi:ribonuclease P protein component
MDQRFRWSDRLHRRREFTHVFKKGHRYVSSGLVLWVYSDPERVDKGARLGLAIPGAYGNAVQRNRLKRLLREIFRLNKTQLPKGTDLVFSSRTLIPKVRYQTLEPIVKGLWHKAKLLSS